MRALSSRWPLGCTNVKYIFSRTIINQPIRYCSGVLPKSLSTAQKVIKCKVLMYRYICFSSIFCPLLHPKVMWPVDYHMHTDMLSALHLFHGSKNLDRLWLAYEIIRTAGRFYKLQLLSVDSRYFAQSCLLVRFSIKVKPALTPVVIGKDHVKILIESAQHS